MKIQIVVAICDYFIILSTTKIYNQGTLQIELNPYPAKHGMWCASKQNRPRSKSFKTLIHFGLHVYCLP